MAARGVEGKQKVIDNILSTFEGSFINGKELRVPIRENDGALVEIKISLTCAKDVLSSDTTSLNNDNPLLTEEDNQNILSFLQRKNLI